MGEYLHPEKITNLNRASGTRGTLRNIGTEINSGYDHSMRGVAEDAVKEAKEEALYVDRYGSWHEGGCHFGFGDGRVMFLSENINPKVYSHLGNHSDGQMLGNTDTNY